MRGQIIENIINTSLEIDHAEPARPTAPRGQIIEKGAAEDVIGKNAVKIASDHGAIGRQLIKRGSSTFARTSPTRSSAPRPTSTAAADALDIGRPKGVSWSSEHKATPQRPSQLSL